MWEAIGYQFYACGKEGLPRTIHLKNYEYTLSKSLKHDFFAATALYKLSNHQGQANNPPPKVVLKMHRKQHLLGLPMSWLGKILRNHEVENLRRLQFLSQVPKLISLYDNAGFIYEYIDGLSLAEAKDLSDDFFDRLLDLLNRIHSRGIAYLDMNKRSNIIIGTDGRPFLIDFQISLYVNKNPLIGKSLAERLSDCLQKADLYHLFKHKRKLKPQLLTPEEKNISLTKTKLIALHRLIAEPFKKLRRDLLRYLYSKNILPINRNITYNPEDDSARFLQ